MDRLVISLILIIYILFLILIFTRNHRNSLLSRDYTLKKEGFENKDDELKQNIQKLYKNFTDFHNYFCPVWEKSITTLGSLNIEQPPLNSPKDMMTKSKPPTLSKSELDSVIQGLRKELNKDLPPICSITYPDILNLYEINKLQEITDNIPENSDMYVNALEWVNGNLKKSQDNLQQSLQGKPVEAFQTCEDIQKCIREGNKKQEEDILMKLQNKLQGFLKNSDKLISLVSENKQLSKNAENIKSRALSGDLMKDINVKDYGEYPKLVPPPGANKLQQMEKNNPERYDEIKRNYPTLVSLKGMFEKINKNY